MNDLGPFDVLVAGGGNAALCAAIEAAERGLSVLICEAAPVGVGSMEVLETRGAEAYGIGH